jgi:UPF0755 protein
VHKRLKMVLLGAFVLGLLLLGLGVWGLQWLQTPQSHPAAAEPFVIKKGESTAKIAENLGQKGLLRWPHLWRFYAQLVETKPLQAGEYALPNPVTPLALLHLFQRGEVMTYSVTFPEGIRYQDFIALLAQQPKLVKVLADKPLEEHKKLLAFNYEYLEGWFFPDTYLYRLGDSDKDILLRAHKKMQQTLEKLWRQRAKDLPLASASEALILASIIEKETGVAHERGKIAGVFVRRLQQKMKLQTDPTVIYGLGDAYTGNISSRDLQQPTPYNTYLIEGLPPTPIANPGYHALAAALNPEPGDALYFVGKGDGSHAFSTTLEQHNAAVAQYQKAGRSENYRSSPAPATGR